MLVSNLTRQMVLGTAVGVADTSAKRRTGLLKHQTLSPGEGLWILPCEGVHTFGMKFPIDIVFLSKTHQVLKVRTNVPRRRASMCLRAYSVLELPVGTIDETGTRAGDQLAFEDVSIAL
jgi:uncharacterized protein